MKRHAADQMLRLNITALVLVAFIAGCGRQATQGQTLTQDGEIRRDFATITGEAISPYYGGLAQPEYRIVKSREEWAELWLELEPRTSREQGQTSPNPLPDIDFQRSVLIIAAMGSRPTGGQHHANGNVPDRNRNDCTDSKAF